MASELFWTTTEIDLPIEQVGDRFAVESDTRPRAGLLHQLDGVDEQ